MKKDSIQMRNGKGDWRGKKLTIGMDLGDRTSRYCVLGEEGEVLLERSVATTQQGLSQAFGALPHKPRCDRDWAAFAMGEPAREPVGTRGHRGPRPERAADRGKHAQG